MSFLNTGNVVHRFLDTIDTYGCGSTSFVVVFQNLIQGNLAFVKRCYSPWSFLNVFAPFFLF